MFGLIWGVTARAYYALRRFMPTNILLDALHTRRGLKWGVPSMVLSVPYAVAAVLCAGLVEGGESGWLDLLAILFAWNALKIAVAGPVTLLRLLRVRGREARARASAREGRRQSAETERTIEPALSSRHV
jgi:hypothetical protein